MAQEILPNLWLGDLTDAHTFDGAIICVHESPTARGPRSQHIPIMYPYNIDHTTMLANPQALDRVSDMIGSYLGREEPILIHCFAGAERAPLAVAWHLRRSKGWTIQQAYEHISRHRTVLDRQHWLPASP